MNNKMRCALTRRLFLSTAGQAGVIAGVTRMLPESMVSAATQAKPVVKGKERLIVRSIRPEDLETPVELLNSFITPNDLFYVRSHMYNPITDLVDLQMWRLRVDGEVATPLTLSIDQLKQLPRATVTVTLECAGNGRAFFDPPVAGIQWQKGAVGTARFTGARLADILKRAGLKSTGRHVFLDGLDRPVGTMPDFVRNLPIEKAMHADTLIAYEMNGVVIPPLNGFPLRAIVPGWEGAYSVKWLQHITVSPSEHDGFFVKTAYRYPTKKISPGAPVDAKDMAPLTGLVVKSLITSPADRSTVKAGAVPVSGFAWAGEDDIAKVDVSMDNGATWRAAQLGREQERYTWRHFRYEFNIASSGYYSLMSRATDTKGNVQPIEVMWNPSGYLWNAIDRVRINVEG